MDDDIVDDADLAALDPAGRVSNSRHGASGAARPAANGTDAPNKVQQPKPQAIARQGASAILVNNRQKGNPVLNNIKSMPWEWADIAADFVLGATTCAMFLSLKYHRLHPEYVYSRIKALGGKYNLRILLVMVDITNHEEPLKELSKTSLINNVTIILAWSAQEAGRYLELYKSYEHAAPTSIKAHQSTSYSDQLIEFVTVPRSINKTDAVGLVSNFGSIRTAVNARPEEIALIAGWGEKKVQRWCQVVREPFRIQKTAKRGITRENTKTTTGLSQSISREDSEIIPVLSRNVNQMEDERDAQVAARLGIGAPLPINSAPSNLHASSDADKRLATRIANDFPIWEPGADEEEALAEIGLSETVPAKPSPQPASVPKRKQRNTDDDLADGVLAALNKLRKT